MREAIAKCTKTIEEAETTSNEEYISFVIEEETALVENLLGTAFVLCQSYIAFVVSRVKALHKSCEKIGVQLSTTDGSKTDIMRFGNQLLLGTQYSQVQAINAFANYFKHHEEWKGHWEQLKGKPAGTVQVLLETGAKQFSTGNFSTAAKRLGNESYKNLEVFAKILRGWGQAVHERYNVELGEKGLL